jgi:signal transduction histidine kinase
LPVAEMGSEANDIASAIATFFMEFPRSVTASSALAFSASVFAQATGTAAEAKAMLEKAIAALKANEANALASFNKADGGYRDRDLYVYCFEKSTGKFTVHVNAALMGTDVSALKEKDGAPLGQKVFDAAKEGTITTINYNFPKPGSTDPVPKEAFVTAVGNQGCGVGYYK